jgi:hypothetical protein
MCRFPITLRGTTLLTNVADLINPMMGFWDDQLVGDIFWEKDAEVILALHVEFKFY